MKENNLIKDKIMEFCLDLEFYGRIQFDKREDYGILLRFGVL